MKETQGVVEPGNGLDRQLGARGVLARFCAGISTCFLQRRFPNGMGIRLGRGPTVGCVCSMKHNDRACCRLLAVVAGCCEHGNEPSGFVKSGEFLE
jgi:hypothetical protein